ncbi:MAG: hypothetical protein M5U07_05015 [Xanthobacteraceae bacterium]|nr:hypothetical protein [Xanthobacteraceae bacterium]
MDWFAAVDIYCERTAPGLWNEPLNAASNLAFLVAALAATRATLRAPAARRDGVLWALVAVVYLVAAGSAAFHTFANRWSLIADVAPITAFIYLYFAVAMRRFLGLGRIASIALTLLFFAASWAFGAAFPPDALNGSIAYLPAFFALAGLGALLGLRGASAGRPLLAASLLFLVSLAFRTIDQAVCAALPIGTHYAWHALNAILLYGLLITAIRHGTGVEKTSVRA